MSKLKWRIMLVLALMAAFCGTAAAQAIYVNESGSVVCGYADRRTDCCL